MQRRRWNFLLIICILFVGINRSARGGNIEFSDATFDDGDWTTTFVGGAPAGFSGSTGHQELTGGIDDDGPYRQHSFSIDWPDVLSVDLMHVHNSAVFDPSTTGAITAITGSYSYKDFTTGNANFTSTWFSIVQDDSIYRYIIGAGAIENWAGIGPGAVGNPANWIKVTGAGAATPDFTATGTAIQFGYLSRVNFNNDGVETFGIDNWKYTVTYEPASTPVPEPSSLILLTLGAIGCIGCWKRRKN